MFYTPPAGMLSDTQGPDPREVALLQRSGERHAPAARGFLRVSLCPRHSFWAWWAFGSGFRVMERYLSEKKPEFICWCVLRDSWLCFMFGFVCFCLSIRWIARVFLSLPVGLRPVPSPAGLTWPERPPAANRCHSCPSLPTWEDL